MSAIEVVALTGGVGGAKLALGLQRVLPPGALACVVNPGDDFDHLGLRICPDLDTHLYTLSGMHDEARGWGRRDETWRFMDALRALAGPDWFALGDGDLAVHVLRTARLRAGATPTEVAAEFTARLGIPGPVLPACDEPVATLVRTPAGTLAFQEYFVARRAAPAVLGLEYAGADRARPTASVLAALAAPGLRAVVVCPSNPWLSIDPLRAVPGLEAAVRAAGRPVVAVCPLIGGRAVKGPTAKIVAELGLAPTPATIAGHYAGLIDGLVIDPEDAAWATRCAVPTHVVPTLMTTLQDRERVARETLSFAAALGARTAT